MARGRLYVTTTISPNMLDSNIRPIMELHEIDFDTGYRIAKANNFFHGNVGHRDTADMLGVLLHMNPKRLFGRKNLKLKVGDRVLAFIPQFKDTRVKELTDEEIQNMTFRIFYAEMK